MIHHDGGVIGFEVTTGDGKTQGVIVSNAYRIRSGRGGRLFRDLGADRLPPPGRRRSPGDPDPRVRPGVGGGDQEVLGEAGGRGTVLKPQFSGYSETRS